jgi:uncharacterized protein (TIGR02270 family)
MLDVLEEHFEELDFLWEQRERVLFAPDWMIDQLGELEARAEAHLDGLVIGAGHSVAIAKPYLVAEETGVATAAAFTLLAMDSAPLALDVVDSLRMGPPAAREGIKLALFHSDVRNVVDAIYELSMGRDINLRALATEVLAFHRLRPPPEVERLLEHQDVGVRRRATWATGRFGSMTSAAFERGLRDEDRTLRKWTLEAAAYCGLPELLPLCRGMTRGPDASHEALAFLGVVGDRQDLTTLKAALSDRRLAAGAIAGMASLGNVAAVPLLLGPWAIRIWPLRLPRPSQGSQVRPWRENRRGRRSRAANTMRRTSSPQPSCHLTFLRHERLGIASVPGSRMEKPASRWVWT